MEPYLASAAAVASSGFSASTSPMQRRAVARVLVDEISLAALGKADHGGPSIEAVVIAGAAKVVVLKMVPLKAAGMM